MTPMLQKNDREHKPNINYIQTCFSDHLYWTITCIMWLYFYFSSQCILFQLNMY